MSPDDRLSRDLAASVEMAQLRERVRELEYRLAEVERIRDDNFHLAERMATRLDANGLLTMDILDAHIQEVSDVD